jgi:hypothetical protein
MTPGQQGRLQDLIDDYRSDGFSNDQIEGAVRRLAGDINPPDISPTELNDLLRRNKVIN